MNRPAKPADHETPCDKAVHLEYEDNRLVLQLFGAHHGHLAQIEQKLDIVMDARGNQVTLSGLEDAVAAGRNVLDVLYGRLKRGLSVGRQDVDAALRMMSSTASRVDKEVAVHIRNRTVLARSPTQASYIDAIDKHDLVFGLGPAGTGKTYLAVAKAVERLVNGDVDRIILSRPAVEAGEQLGFLPGDMREKVDPYLRPLYDALYDMLPAPQVVKRLDSGDIEVAPLAFMRGRTLANAFVILDEAQNTTAVQMKMFLTRLGDNSRMVITGDLSQVDLPKGTRSGLRHAVEVLADVSSIAFIAFAESDVVRHPLVTQIVRAYNIAEEQHGVGSEYEPD